VATAKDVHIIIALSYHFCIFFSATCFNNRISEGKVLKNNSKIIIASDSTSDLGVELIQKYNIKINPLYIVKDYISLRDGEEINPTDVYEYVTMTSTLPKTAAANVKDHYGFLKQFTDEGYSVIYFTISSSMSSNFNNARIAAGQLEGVYVVDSKNLSTGVGLQVLYAADLAAENLTAGEIYSRVIDMQQHIDASFIIDTLEYLNKGGRCSSLAALGANLLKLKPCIEVKSGNMIVGKKYRGKLLDVLKEYVNARLADKDDIELDRIFITHSGCSDEITDEISKLVKQILPFKEVFITRAGCTISVHCGPGTLGILFVRKSLIQ